METTKRKLGEIEITVNTVRTLIIGAGAAGLNAAEHLRELGHTDIAIVTDASAGASSTAARAEYYRMGMDWNNPDSPAAFAKTLVEGGMAHGDNAYAEAVNSIPEFLHLVRNGVPFPVDDYGIYTGTGEKSRATTAGPSTSKLMAEKSLDALKQARVFVMPRHEVIAIFTTGEGSEKTVAGALAVDIRKVAKPEESFVLFNCRNIILATGGPTALFPSSIYPEGSPSGHAIAVKAGAALSNVTETRFGLAFAKARKPISGNLQKVIPSYYSLGKGGREMRFFLGDYFHATKQIASAIFFKGEHWEFSTTRLQSMGPSVIDIAIYNELSKGRRVFIDFSKNVKGENIGQFNISQLDPAAREFLEKTQTTQFTPFDRLRHLDPGLIDAFVEQKVDLREPQEVTICSEDTFGGVSVNRHWETSVKRLFAIGDVSATHGNPPTGSRLNAGQVGGLCAARFIASKYAEPVQTLDTFIEAVTAQAQEEIQGCLRYQHGPLEVPAVKAVRTEIQKRMAATGGMVRGTTGITEAIEKARKHLAEMRANGQRLSRAGEFIVAVENELLCTTQIAFLEGIRAYIERGGGSRGGYLVLDDKGDSTVLTKRGSELRHRNENMGLREQILEVRHTGGLQFESALVAQRPVPKR